MIGLALQRHRCVSLLPLAAAAHERLDDFFAVECRAADECLPDDTAALIVSSGILTGLCHGRVPVGVQSVTVVGDSVPAAFLDDMRRRRVLVTWPKVSDVEDEAQAMEVCQDVLAAFGFGRLGARPRNVINDELLCDCC
ncbi:hypothetical protein [Bordetella avium]|uniref:Phage protein n=1 Tax=Bordetella avium (strain 197N) TaxID=360910 RepID=Q2L0G8_BORA1|nr:hypothetical protein [Bordetella avium]AZY49248.1 hypothetical protein C0J09_08910 [Bordetella avium]AZY52604.1 hypothetical protein C0J07_08895 [Bordetella avium]RIQ12728.1 hypothetical protein D0432_11645 [Bordetella avium]RIQ19235.1 hypothetical protein D0850_03990 [Bordetella avium]RIQ33402.1 hypothetical protein D0849_10680 [Bordetella avium]